MNDDERPTESIRRVTRPLEVPVWLEGLRYPVRTAGGASCTRCGGQVEPLSQGHYQDAHRAFPGSATRFHFCCPVPPGCEVLQAP